MTTRHLRRVLSMRWPSLLLVVALGAALYLPFLGFAGFTQSEGFRVFPAWHMLHSGDFLVTRLFEQPYLRKPPGMPWAIAAMSSIFGENEWAARSVSGFSMILGGLLCWFAARRWYGPTWYASLAGVAYLVAPMFWADPGPGRAAEIEALHNLCVLTVMVLIVETLGPPNPRLPVGQASRLSANQQQLRHRSVLLIPILGLALAAEFLVKGPSGFPALGGLLLAFLLISRKPKPLLALLPALAIAAALILWWFFSLKAAVANLDPAPVKEPPAQFLWTPGKELKILLLPLSALIAGLPFTLTAGCTLALPPRERANPGKLLALALFLGIALYTLLGVSNARYVMPALILGPLSFPGCWVNLRHGHARNARRVGRFLQIHRPGFILLILALAGAVYSVRLEHRKSVRTSGLAAGILLGHDLAADVLAHTPPGQPPAAQVWGDEFLDTRPEVLWYARRQAATQGVALRVIWKPGLDKSLATPPSGNYLILRDDRVRREFRDPEWPAFEHAGIFAGAKPVATGTAHVFTFRVYRTP